MLFPLLLIDLRAVAGVWPGVIAALIVLCGMALPIAFAEWWVFG